MPRQSYAFRVGAIAPVSDPAWHAAGESVHRAFWGAVVGFVITEKNRELAEGLDIFGDPLTPIAESTRRKGRWRSYTGHGTADAPPLTPAGALSRTRSLFTGRAHADHAEFFWRYDAVSGQHWGRILGFHRDGAGYLPERDVIGLSPQSLANVERKAHQWWADWKAGRAHGARAAELRVVLPPVPSGRPSFVRPVAGAHFDLDRFTFGIGGSREQVASAMARGTSTGFRQLPPRGPAPRAPAARPRPAPPPTVERPVPAARPPGRIAASPRPDLSVKPRPTPAPKPRAAPQPPPAPKPEPKPKPSPLPAAPEAQPPKTLSFGPSKARVEIAQGDDVLGRLKALTGRDLTRQDIASLVGATDQATVRARLLFNGDIQVSIEEKRYRATRTIQQHGGIPLIHNDIFRVGNEYQGQGLGGEVLGRQVEHASKWGFDRIETSAARSSGPDGYNGYYTWPRLGYDGPIDPDVRRKLPEAWKKDVNTVSDLMINQERRNWWKEHGVWTEMQFDLRPGSRSIGALQSSIQESKAKKPKPK